MRDAYREHIKRGNYQRVFPASPHFENSELIENLTKNNKNLLNWFKAQCKNDKNWC